MHRETKIAIKSTLYGIARGLPYLLLLLALGYYGFNAEQGSFTGGAAAVLAYFLIFWWIGVTAKHERIQKLRLEGHPEPEAEYRRQREDEIESHFDL